jgi:hypothetical protein
MYQKISVIISYLNISFFFEKKMISLTLYYLRCYSNYMLRANFKQFASSLNGSLPRLPGLFRNSHSVSLPGLNSKNKKILTNLSYNQIKDMNENSSEGQYVDTEHTKTYTIDTGKFTGLSPKDR